jgi:hypothetical protein
MNGRNIFIICFNYIELSPFPSMLLDFSIEFNTSVIKIKIETNGMRIIKNVDNYIFMFSNNELYALNISINEISNLRFIGKFTHLGENIEFIEVILVEIMLRDAFHIILIFFKD